MPARARIALAGAGTLLLALILTWYAAFNLAFVAHVDRSILTGFGVLGAHPRVSSLADFVAHLCDPNPYVYLVAVPLIVALARRRPWVAVAIAVIVLGANLSTQLLKPLLAQPRPSGGLLPAAASWPSGHATAAMSLALVSVLASPSRLRPIVAALGGAFAVAVSYSFLSLRWHFPSDVLGGYLMAGVWTLIALAALFALEARGVAGVRGPARPRSPVGIREALVPPSAAVLGAGALGALIAIARPHQVIAYAHAHTAFMIGAGAIGAAGLALATGVMLALRR